jgi:hypothetical protein
MVLRCATCEHKQFQTIDNLGQRWACQRCDARSNLDQWAWKSATDEPTWFYDLHPVGRQVLRDNGDVPALLSSYIRNQRTTPRSQLDDVTEIEFTKDGQPQVELDLVTYIDDTITVAECKSSGNELVGRAGRKEITKKCQAATWLRADQLIFATKADPWAAKSRSTIQATVRQYNEWGPMGAPRVCLISSLGADNVVEDTL